MTLGHPRKAEYFQSLLQQDGWCISMGARGECHGTHEFSEVYISHQWTFDVYALWQPRFQIPNAPSARSGSSEAAEKWGVKTQKVRGQKPDFGQNLSFID